MPPWYCMSLFWERAGWLLSNVFVPEPWRGIQSRGTFNRSVYLNTFFSFSVLMMGEFTVFITGKQNMQHWMFVELGLALHSLAYLLAFFWQADAFKGRKKQKTQKSTHVWYAVTFFFVFGKVTLQRKLDVPSGTSEKSNAQKLAKDCISFERGCQEGGQALYGRPTQCVCVCLPRRVTSSKQNDK